jgi:hypothetical protein
MSDIVKKYQHYFAESTRLQEMVNEQAAYIEELEAAILELSELDEMAFDSRHSAKVSRGNVKAAEKAVAQGLKPKEFLAKVKKGHEGMKKSRGVYGVSDDELNDAANSESGKLSRGKGGLRQIKMKAKGFDGYDASHGIIKDW